MSTRDDEILGRVLRRLLTDEDEFASTTAGDLIVDGRIRLDDTERAVVDRVLRRQPAPPRRVREGETFDVAPFEIVEVIRDLPGAGTLILLTVSGGPFGVRGARFA